MIAVVRAMGVVTGTTAVRAGTPRAAAADATSIVAAAAAVRSPQPRSATTRWRKRSRAPNAATKARGRRPTPPLGRPAPEGFLVVPQYSFLRSTSDNIFPPAA